MLTDDEKVRTRRHMGYLGVSSVQTFALGVPATVQTTFIIEGSMNKLMPEAEPYLRDVLDKLDAIELQLFDNVENVAVLKLGDIELNPKEYEKVIQRYQYFQGNLANLLGCQPNPYDQRFTPWLGARGINTPVINS